MKSKLQEIRQFPIVLPIVFVLLFFALMPVKFKAVLHTENIVGEGICSSYCCNPSSFSPFYETTFYFGSELKTAIVRGYQYNVDNLTLEISDVSQFDITGLDIYVWNIPVKHYDGNQILTTTDRMEVEKGVFINTGEAFHVEVNEPKEGIGFSINKEMIPKLFWVVYFAVMLTASLLLTLLVGYLSKRWRLLPAVLASVSGVTVALLAGQFFCGSLPMVEFRYFALNLAILGALSLLLGAITIPQVGVVATMVFTTFWYIANYFVIALRGKPVMPADLKAIGTAAEVMGGYLFRPSWRMLLGVVVVAVYAVAVVSAWKKARQAAPPAAESGGAPLPAKSEDTARPSVKRRLLTRAVCVAAAALTCVVCIHTDTFENMSSFAWDVAMQKSFHEQGIVLTFLKNALNSRVVKPEGYSVDAVNGYLAEYQASAQETDKDAIRPTNIIMVMDEAFSDLRTVGLDENVDVMPFIDSLQENTVEGRLHVSVFGGGTCNTEFEGLTGNTLAFFNSGAYPYTSNITDSMFSLARYFRDKGYFTAAFHANEPQNWNRNRVYPFLGFDEFYSYADYMNALGEIPYLHEHPSDAADFSFIEQVDEEKKDQPRFLFNVTMQNHSPYDKWVDVEEAESVQETVPSLYMDTRVYLSLVKASDDAVKQLVETYQNSDEPTMIIYFGDHQPGLPDAAKNENYTKLNSFLDLYTSKFFIWTNYETEAMHDVEVSANYLPYLVMKQGNFEMPPYIQMLGELYEAYPIISAMGVMNKDEEIYASVDLIEDDPLLQKYRYVQYANVFDEIDDGWFES